MAGPRGEKQCAPRFGGVPAGPPAGGDSQLSRLSDVDAAVDILQHLGASCRWEGEELVVDAGQASGTAIDEGRMRAMRSSIMFLGPLAARMGEATLTYPGGCELGPRPIDLHLEALRAMGC